MIKKLLYAVKILFDRIVKMVIIVVKGHVSYARHQGVRVGEECRIYISDFGSEPFLIQIGSKVTIAPNVKLITHDGSTWLFRDEKGRRYHYRRIEIGNNVFIGMNSILMPGVKVGDNVIVGAGSVVTKSIPSGLVVAGNPAKVIMTFADYEKKALANFVSDREMLKSESYKEGVVRVSDKSFKDMLKKSST